MEHRSPPGIASPSRRLRLREVEVVSDLAAGRMRVRVELELSDSAERSYAGEALGGVGRESILRLSAQAAVQALNTLTPGAPAFRFADARQVRLHAADTVLVMVDALTGPYPGEPLAGVALVKHDLPDAVVRATLDAVNRPLGRLLDAATETGGEGAAS